MIILKYFSKNVKNVLTMLLQCDIIANERSDEMKVLIACEESPWHMNTMKLPKELRSRERSKTFPGIARQWQNNGERNNMFHCFINYKIKNASGISEVFKTKQFHVSAETEKDIRNIKNIITELLNRLGIEHSTKIMYMPVIIEKEGEDDEDIS